MTRIEEAVARIRQLLEPATSYTNGAKIYEPLPSDPNATLKNQIIGEAGRALCLAEQWPAGVPATLIENRVFHELTALSDNDVEKQDYSELLNASQNLLIELTKQSNPANA